jgi:hypothetical protein
MRDAIRMKSTPKYRLKKLLIEISTSVQLTVNDTAIPKMAPIIKAVPSLTIGLSKHLGNDCILNYIAGVVFKSENYYSVQKLQTHHKNNNDNDDQ